MSVVGSPYRRTEAPPQHQACPNCGNVVAFNDLQTISYGCIVRHYRKIEKLQKEQLQGHNNAGQQSEGIVASLDTIFSDNNLGWANLPPILRRLKCPLSELYTRKALLQQTTRLCVGCYDEFVDEEEAHQAASAVARKKFGASVTKSPKRPQLPFCATRQPDRCKDMVFSSLQQTQRTNEKRIARKRNLRHQYITSNKQTIDWDGVPVRSVVQKQIRDVSPPRPPKSALSSTHPSQLPLQPIPRDDPLPSGHTHPKPMQIPPMEHFLHRTPSSAALVPTPLNEELISESDDGQVVGSSSPTADVAEVLPEPPRVSRFDVSFAEHCMFELYDHLSKRLEFGVAKPDGAAFEDVPKSHRFFTVYRQNALRLPPPPVDNVELYEMQAIDNDMLKSEHSEGVSTAEVFDAAAADLLQGQLEDLTQDEHDLLMGVIADPTILPEEVGVDDGLIDGIVQVEEEGTDSDEEYEESEGLDEDEWQ